MTKDEAIEKVKRVKGIYAYESDYEALDMAIEALKHYKRAETLLKATHDLLSKQKDSYYVLNMLSETVFYDSAECDGSCLLEDIECFLEIKE